MDNTQLHQTIEEVRPKSTIKIILFLIIGVVIGGGIMSIFYFLPKGNDLDLRENLLEDLQEYLEEDLFSSLDGNYIGDIYKIEKQENSIEVFATINPTDEQLGQFFQGAESPGFESFVIFAKAEYKKEKGTWVLQGDPKIYLGMDMDFMEQSSNNAQISANNARIKSDVLQARTYAELIWANNSSYMNLCVLNSLNETEMDYGVELKSLEDDIATRQGGTLTIRCQANGDSYCISAQLVGGMGKYFCADSDGRVADDVTSTACTAISIDCR